MMLFDHRYLIAKTNIMKKFFVILVTVLFSALIAPVNAQNHIDGWMYSLSFFPETEDLGHGLHYINFSSVPSMKRSMLQFSVDYENNFLPDTRRSDC